MPSYFFKSLFNGTISIRSVFHKTNQAIKNHYRVKQWRQSLSAFSSRLHWHDHFIQRLESAPQMEFQALNPAYESIIMKMILINWKHGEMARRAFLW